MRMQVCCSDNLAFTQQLLNLLATNALELPGIEHDSTGNLLLHLPKLDNTKAAELIVALRQIPGVTTVIPHLSQRSAPATAFEQLIGPGEKMSHLLDQARKLAVLNAPLLIIGDTGTGKDLLAYACHKASPRASQPYLALNCAAIPEDVVESELFGHAPGAYPNALESKKGFFEQANGGSVLLDEIGEMSAAMQVKLLRFLNDGIFRRVGEDHEVHVDVRIICATQKNLELLVQQGIFREDLYYRLKVLTLELPVLRDRPQDIIPLAEHFIADFAREQGIICPTISATLSQRLTHYSWPGNVRQLKNTLYRALAQREGNQLRAQDILLPEFNASTVHSEDTTLNGSLEEIIQRFERSVLIQLYRDYPSTRKLARRLNVSHTAIANKLRDYDISQKKLK